MVSNRYLYARAILGFEKGRVGLRFVLVIAHLFNTFFTKSVEELATNFQPIEFDAMQRDLSTSFHIKEVNESKIGKVIRQSKAEDYFGLDTLSIKKHSSVVQVPVNVVNCSVRSNEFPEP